MVSSHNILNICTPSEAILHSALTRQAMAAVASEKESTKDHVRARINALPHTFFTNTPLPNFIKNISVSHRKFPTLVLSTNLPIILTEKKMMLCVSCVRLGTRIWELVYNTLIRWIYWCILVIPKLGSLKQEGHESQACLGSIKKKMTFSKRNIATISYDSQLEDLQEQLIQKRPTSLWSLCSVRTPFIELDFSYIKLWNDISTTVNPQYRTFSFPQSFLLSLTFMDN